MLEDRPIVQKTLVGSGAFAFVFAAAMAGSAFMISGGFGASDEPRSVREDAVVVRYVPVPWQATSDFEGRRETVAVTRVSDTYSDAPEDAYQEAYQEEAYQDAYFENSWEPIADVESLEGDAAYARYEDRAVHSEDEVRRQIEREYAALAAETHTYDAEADQPEMRIAEVEEAESEADDLF